MAKIKKIISLTSIGLIAGALIAGNVVAFHYSPMITTFLSGTGDRGFDSDDFKKTSTESDALCQKVAEEGIVMLKNEDNCLPLKETKKINVFGWSSTEQGFLLSGIGSGSSTISDDKKVSLLKGLEEEGFEYNKELEEFYNNYDSSTFSFSTGSSKRINLIEPSIDEYSDDLIDNAIDFSDVAMVVISRVGGENVGEIPTVQKKSHGQETDKTRTYLEISTEEEDLINMVKENFSKVIIVINSTNQMQLGFLQDEDIQACLYVGVTGQSGAKAIGKILDGTVNPSGHLTDTLAYDYTAEPAYKNRIQQSNNIEYREDIYIGYKYYETADANGYFDDVDNDYGTGYDGVVAYPFGYGLSYTTFEWTLTDSSISNNSTLKKDDTITLTFSCKNTGKVAGKAVMEVYYSAPYYDGEIEKSAVNLVEFAKTDEIEPGKTENNITVEFTPYDMASYDCYDKNNNGYATWELDSGDYEIQFKDDSHTLKEMDQNTLTYHVDDTIIYDTDPVTGNEVKNRFTGDDAYSGVPIDASTIHDSEVTYLSRSDFSSTFPTTATVPENTSEVTKANDYTNTSYDTTEMPTTGADNGLYLVTKEDGSKASMDDLNGSSSNTLKYNDELIEEIGNNYDSEKLTQLVEQMTTSELKSLVENGGFHTYAVESIGKPRADEFDGPAGFNTTTQTGKNTGSWTAFPNETLIGQTWSKEIATEMGESMANEAKATGLSGWYAPGVNLHRTAFNGRNYEYYSEDATLSGYMAAYVIKGAKSKGLHCYLKHFTLSEPGVNAKGYNTWLTEQNFRENYLKPFEIAVKKGGANSIMTAFNSVGGVWAGANYAMNVEVLRNEWGFRGSLITDWSDGSGNMLPYKGIRGGNDLWLNPNDGNISNGLNMKDATTVKCCQNAARNIIYTFCNTYTYSKNAGNTTTNTSTPVKQAFAWWKILLISIDVVAAGALGFWVFMLFKPKKEKN